MAYRVPDEKADAVLADLDFREKGGYTRAVVDIYRADGESADGESDLFSPVERLAADGWMRRSAARYR